MPQFDSIQHPDYERMLTRWKMARAFSRGGIHVLDPDYPASTGLVGIPRASDTSGNGEDPGLAETGGQYDWISRQYNSFLWKHQRELDEEFRERQKRAIHLPLFQSLGNTFSAGILRKPPKYTNGPPEGQWKAYTENVDMSGTNMDAFRRLALGGGFTYGNVYGLTDRPAFQEGAVSLGEQLERNERPYSYLVTPLEIPDWELNQFGEFVWVRIAQNLYQPRSPGDPPGAVLTQYLVLYQNGWERYYPEEVLTGETSTGNADGSTNYVAVDGGETTLNRVPLRKLNLSKEGQRHNMAVESPLSDALDADRYTLNGMSELDEMERSQAFAILFVPGQRRGALDLGAMRAIGGEDATMAPQYISPGAELADAKLRRINDKLWAFKQFEGAGRGVAEYSKEERSGEALNIETEDKRNQMALWSSCLQDFENGLYEDAAGLSGEQDHPVVKYADSFDVKSISAQVQEVVALAGAGVGMVPRSAAVRVATPIMERMMRDAGESDEAVEEVRSIMKNYADETPMEPQPVPSQPPRPENSEGGDA